MVDTDTDIVQDQAKRADLPKKKAKQSADQKIKVAVRAIPENTNHSENIECYIGLGSNIGKTKENIESAIQMISECDGISIKDTASLYLTKAWGKTNQQNFVNTVVKIVTHHKPLKLLDMFQAIESQLGRVKIEKWGPRLIDIDILLYADIVVKEPLLTIPHPYLTQRSFVLAPLYELNKHILIPKLGKLEKFIDDEQLKEDILEIF